MCLVAIAIDHSRRFPLVVASNRDEYFERPTAGLAWWSPKPGDPAILSGRDLESGGTWMGLTAQGRFALLTNVRGVLPVEPGAPSRGRVVTDWLTCDQETGDFWMRTALSGYNGFNLIAADFRHGECFWASNTKAHPQRLARGLYGLSNGRLDEPWPKVGALKARLQTALDASASADRLATQLFAALADRTLAADAALPRTGVPLDRERQLSAAFIASPDRRYGTRCSTVIITEKTGHQPLTHVYERSFDADVVVTHLRRSQLRNWPPCHVEGDAYGPAAPGVVLEHELAAGDTTELA